MDCRPKEKSASGVGYAHDRPNGYPVQIVEIKGGKLELNEKELETILMQPQLKDKRVMILSIAGIFRSGKSFLLSLLIRYLSQGGSQNWMDDKDYILDGFKWRSGSERETTGIWMWSKVFFTRLDGTEVGVVLMDTQGTQDKYSSTKENASIFALSTLLSSVQIYNVKTDINEADLQFLQLFVRFGISITGKKGGGKKHFQTLLFLIRDWQNPRENKFGKDGGAKHLTKCMEIHPKKQSKENQDLRKSIHGVFADIMCFLMPRPGEEICEGDTNGHIADISNRFLVQINDLAKLLFSSDVSEVKRIDDKDVTCGSLFDYFKDYVKTIREGKVLEITSIAEAHALAHDRQSSKEVMRDFEEEMDKLCENYQKDLEGAHVQMMEKTLELFKKKCGFNPSEEYGKLKADIRKDIDSKMQKYKAANNMKKVKARNENHNQMLEAMKDFEKLMDEKWVTHMDASMLKSMFEENKRHILEKFEKEAVQFEPSYSEYRQQLEINITRKYKVYEKKLKMEHEIKKAEADRAAFEANIKRMEQQAEADRAAADEKIKRMEQASAADRAAAAADRAALEENIKRIEQQAEADRAKLEADNKRMKEQAEADRAAAEAAYRDVVEKNNKRMEEAKAEKTNNAAHDEALVSYRDGMQKGYTNIGSFDDRHRKASDNAEEKYEELGTSGFPSYLGTKRHLLKAIDELRAEFKSKRGVWNWTKSLVGLQDTIVIPSHLFKAQ